MNTTTATDLTSAPSAAAPLVRQKLAEQIYERLLAMIRSGALAAGDYMPSERTLMEQFGVGRPAVREALQGLANRGLITINHGERSRVNQLDAGTALHQIDDLTRLMLAETPENVENLRELRLMLETATLRRAALRSTADDVRRLRERVAAQSRLCHNRPAFIEEDIQFHVTIAAMTGNPIIESVTRAMMGWLLGSHEGLLHWDGQEALTLYEHARVVDYLERNDGEGAVAMMTTHISRSGLAALPQGFSPG